MSDQISKRTLEEVHSLEPAKKIQKQPEVTPVNTKDSAVLPEHEPNIRSTDQAPISELGMNSEDSSRPIKRQRLCGDESEATVGMKDTHNYRHVYLWDLDETLIIFACLLVKDVSRFKTGTVETARASLYAENATDTIGATDTAMANEGYEMGQLMEQLIYHLADKHMFFDDLQVVDPVHIECVHFADDIKDLTTHDFSTDVLAKSMTNFDNNPDPEDVERNLAYRLRHVKELYNSVRALHMSGDSKQVLQRMRELLPVGAMRDWRQTYELIDQLSGNWMTLADLILSTTTARKNSVNVMVTSSQLIPAMSKVMLYSLTNHFAADSIYASRVVGKEECFRKIKARYGNAAVYHVIGDSAEEMVAGKKLGWDTHLVRSVAHLKQLLVNIHGHI